MDLETNLIYYEVHSEAMRPFSDTRLKIITILSDDEGHSHGYIARLLGGKDKGDSDKKKGRHEGYDRGDLTKTLQPMMEKKILHLEDSKYYIMQSEEIFSYIIDQSKKRDKKEFLKSFLVSKYVNGLIRTFGFKSVYSAISKYLGERDFLDIAAPALLSHPATVEEYKELPKAIHEYFMGMEKRESIREAGDKFLKDQAGVNRSSPAQVRKMYSFQQEMARHDGTMFDNKTGELDELEMLRGLGIEGVRFYRKTLLQDFVSLFASMMTNAEKGRPILKYTQLDNHLSPFTAYPVNHPAELMFSRSFGRLYEDVYLIDPGDMSLFLERANLIFQNFPEFLQLYTNSRSNKEAIIRELVLNWNRACAKLESIIYLLREIGYEPSISCFHLTVDDSGIQIIDLKTDQRLLGEMEREKLEAEECNVGFYEFDQTQYMRPVLLEHRGKDWEKGLVPIETMISKMRSPTP